MPEYPVKQLFSRKLIIHDGVLVRELSGEAIMLNLEDEMYYGLDEVGYRMWTVLTNANSIGAAYEQLLSEYEVQDDELLESLDELVGQCMEHGLLLITPQK
jgi:hypothetical protein